jgi:hypothetical protein
MIFIVADTPILWNFEPQTAKDLQKLSGRGRHARPEYPSDQQYASRGRKQPNPLVSTNFCSTIGTNAN